MTSPHPPNPRVTRASLPSARAQTASPQPRQYQRQQQPYRQQTQHSATREEQPPEVARTGMRGHRTLVVVRYAALWGLLCFFLMPVYLLVITALKDPDAVSTTRMWELPGSLSLDSFRAVLPHLGSGFKNSIMLAVPASIISSMLGSANGFVLAKWRFPGANLVFPLILFGIFVPYQAVLIPLVRTTTDAGLRGGADPTGGLRGLILVHIIYGLPITTLIFRNYFAGLPSSLIESSQVDGAGMLRTFFDIGVPMAGPAFAVSIIWQFTAVWNDFLFGAVMTSRSSWPITIALNNIAGGQSVPFNEAMASALLACIPTVGVYILLGRYFLRGLMAGTLQG